MNSKELIKLADDAYYATEYDKAIQLYLEALEKAPKNKHARKQLEKAERNRSLKISPPQLPVEAIQLYKRSRSFIAGGDLTQAKKLLTQAVTIAKKAKTEFPQAEELLNNLSNALKAENLRKAAYEKINAKQWFNAEDNLNNAMLLDPTDETSTLLLSHLKKLCKAQNYIHQLITGGVKTGARTVIIREIQETINETSETSALSTLWQDVVRLFGEYNNQNAVYRNRHKILQWVSLFALSTSIILLIIFWFLYLYPRHRGVEVTCDDIAPGLQAKLDYPYYVANGDHHKIEVTFINAGTSKIDNLLVQVQFQGTANLKYINSDDTNEFELENLNPGKQEPEEIPFYVDRSRSQIRGPWFINFSLVKCKPRDFHIAMAAIPGLQNIIKVLWATFTGGLLGLFSDQIKDFFEGIKRYFKGNGS